MKPSAGCPPDLPFLSTFFARLRLPLLLALLALAGASYAYFAGEAATLPVRPVAHLAPVPLVLDSVAVGPARLPLPVNGYAVTLTHDVAGPYTHPTAATLWLLVLAGALVGWLAVVSTLERPAFLAGTGPVIFLLSSLNVDTLGLFSGSQPYFLWGSLALLGGAAGGLHLLGESVRLPARVALFGALTALLAGLIYWKTPLPLADTTLQLAAYATPAGAVLLALLVLWVGVENGRALLWFNTQADQPEGRFGLLPFVAANLLYVGALVLYWWNDNHLTLAFGLRFDPLVLLLPAVLTSALGLRLRAPSYAGWVPYAAARPLLGLLVAAAAGALGYALYCANTPVLDAARTYTALLLGLLGASFLLYCLVNFGPLIQQRLPVYRVAFEPRRLPLYAVYVLALGSFVALQVRLAWPLLDQVQAGEYNLLGDVARQQSEAHPDDLPQALLAERYYAESGDVLDRFNRPAQLGRAALYRFRGQLQNEQNALRRALLRRPDERVSLRLAALLTEPGDFLAALDVLRRARQATPGSFALTSDLTQLFTRSSLTDSVAVYFGRAEALAPGSPVNYANQLGFLLGQALVPAAAKLAKTHAPSQVTAPALSANEDLLSLLSFTTPPSYQGGVVKLSITSAAPVPADLEGDTFAQVYQEALQTARDASAATRAQWIKALAVLAARPANEPYYEQLLYLQSLLLHAAGQELAARQVLAPLTAGTTASAGYYQYVLGLWQLQQEQYATAATQLAQAARNGFREAVPAQLFAAYVGCYTPDSARAVAKRVQMLPDSAQRRAARQLLQMTELGEGIQAGRWARYIRRVESPTLADTTDLRRWLEKAGPLLPAGGQLYGQAALAQRHGQAARANWLYGRIVQETPFNEPAVLAAGRYYARQRDFTEAYNALNRGLTENPTSEPLLQATALAAADAGLADLGQAALDQLRPRFSPPAYANLLAQFAARRAAQAAARAAFDQPPVPAR